MSGTKTVKRHGVRRLVAKAHQSGRYVEVVPGGARTYLWIGSDEGRCLLTVSGPATLRKLAKAILAEVGE